MGVGLLVGAINGALITQLNVAPFIATLGTLYIARGAALLLSDGATFPNLVGKEEFGTTGYGFLGAGRLFGLPVAIWILIVVALAAAYFARFTPLGRHIFAVGGKRARRRALRDPRHPGQDVRLYVLRILRGERWSRRLVRTDGLSSRDRRKLRA
jgi:erythritol transport system permease protein